MQITLIRHGTTPWNLEHRYQGWHDIPLSPVGHEEARQLTKTVGQEPFEAYYASDLTRCLSTAALIFPTLTVEPTPALRELRFGDWEGHTYSECLARDPILFQQWLDNPEITDPPNGESLLQFEERIRHGLDAIRERHTTNASSRIVIVTHGGVIRAILRTILRTTPREAYATRIRPCSITRVAFTSTGEHVLAIDE